MHDRDTAVAEVFGFARRKRIGKVRRDRQIPKDPESNILSSTVEPTRGAVRASRWSANTAERAARGPRLIQVSARSAAPRVFDQA
jgi:hypothetical protein